MDIRRERRNALADPVRELANAGCCETDIVRKLGIGNLLVKHVAAENDIIIPDGRGRGDQRESWRNGLVETIIDLYGQGLTLRDVARDIRISEGVVRRVLNQRGVARHTRRVGRPAKTLDAADIARRHVAGEPVSRIATSLGVHDDRVLNALAEMNVERTTGAWGAYHHAWKGGRSIQTRSGYVKVTLPRDDPLRVMADPHNGSILEHRYVMAAALGRPLRSIETVHHIDGNRQNNDLQNLQLRFGDHGEGVSRVCLDCGSHNIGAEEV